MKLTSWKIPAAAAVGVIGALLAVPASAQALSGQDLVTTLRQGGYVLVMRHASSPREAPDKQTANSDNPTLERQLDAAGRSTATAMGEAFRRLRIPVGTVLSSPTYRALETVRYAQFGNPLTHPEIGDGGRSMQGGTEAQAIWLRQRTSQFPQGTNTLIVTHQPNIAGAFPQVASGLADGEALIFGPDGKGGAALLARVKIEEWPRF
jgi:phosphohistidine phosphatase SixA